MEGKKSFVLYSDYDELFNELSDEDAGKLIKHILEYVNDRDPKTDNPIIKLSFIPIKKQLQRDLDSWVNTVSKRSEGGKLGNLKRWHKDIYNKVVNSEISIEEGLKEAENRKASDTDRNRSHTIANIAVNDTVNVNVNDNDIKIDWKALIGYFNQVTGKKSRTVDKKAKAQLLARLKDGYTKDDIGKAIRNCANDSYHKENNLKWLTLEFISRPNQFDKWLNTDPIEQPKKSGFAWD